VPSSVTIDERVFPVGPPITRQVDSFPANVKRIRVTMTRVNWPVGNVFKVSVLWSDGTGIAPTVAGGVVLGKDGQPQTVFPFEFEVPQEADGSGGLRDRNVVHGDFSLQVLQEFTSAITIEALT